MMVACKITFYGLCSEAKCYASLIDTYGICWNISLSSKEALSGADY